MERLKQINGQIAALERERREILDGIWERKAGNLKVLVGSCHIVKEQFSRKFAKVIGVPGVRYTLSGPDMNVYQIPVLLVNPDSGPEEIPFEISTLFSRAADSEYPESEFSVEYPCIPDSEFDKAFENAVDILRKMKNCKKQEQ